MEHNTDRILWTVLVLAIGVALFVIFKPAANGLLGQTTEKIQTVNDNTGKPNLIVQSQLKGGYMNRGTGEIAPVDVADFNSDDYIPTNGETVFTFSSPDYVFKGSRNDTLAMYDSNKNYLGCQLITSPTQTLSKSNVAYIRFSINFVDEGGTHGNLSDWLSNHRYKLEKGSIATPYIS